MYEYFILALGLLHKPETYSFKAAICEPFCWVVFEAYPSLPVTRISGTAAVTNISGNPVSVTEPGLITTRPISIQKQ
jgi:hypothetical protein